MSGTGAQHVESIRDAISCPQCAYSLRGLTGDFVVCPECGLLVNVQAYVAAQWREPWYRAPLYNTLALPLAVAVMAFLLMIFGPAWTARPGRGGPDGLVALALFMAVSPLWVMALLFAQRKFGSSEGIWLALLVHLTLPGYLIGLIMLVGGGLATAHNIGTAWWYVMRFVMLMIGGVACIIGARLIERFVAHRCIRRHLRAAADARRES